MYRLTFGEDDHGTVDGLFDAQDWLDGMIDELQGIGVLPGWRAAALHVLVQHMPRAGTCFSIDGVGLVKAELIRQRAVA